MIYKYRNCNYRMVDKKPIYNLTKTFFANTFRSSFENLCEHLSHDDRGRTHWRRTGAAAGASHAGLQGFTEGFAKGFCKRSLRALII